MRVVEPDCTDDAFLGGALNILQPARGFRAGIDSVLLAAAIPAEAGQSALEAGVGAGVASLCLARRVAGLEVCGVEIDPALVALANRNAERNGLGDRVRFEARSVAEADPAMLGRYAHVFANPPFLEEGEAVQAGEAGRRRARLGPEGVLALFVDFCIGAAAPGASVTLIHRADRLDRILAALGTRLGALEIIPLWPRQGVPAKRVIIRGRKGSGAPLMLRPGLVLHGEGNGFTEAAEAVLRHGAPLT
jgi:tRNA1(Val) A37 N6-methylase TrmN6